MIQTLVYRYDHKRTSRRRRKGYSELIMSLGGPESFKWRLAAVILIYLLALELARCGQIPWQTLHLTSLVL